MTTVDVPFVTDDPDRWGLVGLHRQLTAAEFDLTIWTIKRAIETLAIASPNEIASIEQTAPDTIVFHLTDGSAHGVTLPVSTWAFRGDWATATLYAAYDVIRQGAALYLVLFPHTSAGSFDPAANDGSGHDYYGKILEIPANGSPGFQEISGATKTLAVADAWTYFDCTDAAGVTVTIPANASAAIPVGARIEFRHSGGHVTLSPAGGVTLDAPSGRAATTSKKGDVLTLVKVAVDAWQVLGDCARAINSGLATTGAVSFNPAAGDVLITPTGDMTLTPTQVLEDEWTLYVVTAGTTAFNINFGAGFFADGALSTGIADGKRFALRFSGDGSTYLELFRKGPLG